jgi:hypothetical protein
VLSRDTLPQVPWTGGVRPSEADAMAREALATLRRAVGLARDGDCRGARELCAAVVLEAQPLIAARKELLGAALHALLVARGFKLLSGLVMAVSGRRVQVIMLPDETGPVAPPVVREEPRRTTYVLDPRWLARLSADDIFLRHWCDALTAREPCPPVVAEPQPVARHLEPA